EQLAVVDICRARLVVRAAHRLRAGTYLGKAAGAGRAERVIAASSSGERAGQAAGVGGRQVVAARRKAARVVIDDRRIPGQRTDRVRTGGQVDLADAVR